MLRYLFTGLGLPEMALAVNRVAVGLFFFLSGYHKLFNAQRHARWSRRCELQVRHTSSFFSGACQVRNFRRNARRRHQAICQLAANRQGRLA
jgi:hypothetical protein